MLRSALHRAASAVALLLVAAPLRADTLKVPSNDFATIQAALDAAVAGDVVQVGKGVYDENLSIVTAGITLKGKSATINGAYLGPCLAITADDVTVESLALVNGGPFETDGDTGGGLVAVGANITLSKLTVRACNGNGISLTGTGAVEKCTVDACLAIGILADTNDTLGDVVTSISKNTVTRCEDGIFAAEGPFTIDGNTCEENENNGLTLFIPILEGLDIQPTTVTKNKLNGNLEAGMDVSVLAGPQLLVQKNECESNGIGALIEGFNVSIDSNTIDDNVFGGLSAEVSNGFVIKNKVRGNGFVGMVVSDAPVIADGGGVGTNLVEKNTVQDNGGDGIRVLSGANQIHANTIKGNAGDGVDIDATFNLNVVTDNSISDNLHDGIDNSGGSTVIAGNKSKNNGGADIAGAGDGAGTVAPTDSTGNVVSDDSDLSGFTTLGELELETL